MRSERGDRPDARFPTHLDVGEREPDPSPPARPLGAAPAPPRDARLAPALCAALASWLLLDAARLLLRDALGPDTALAVASAVAFVPVAWVARSGDLRGARSELEPCALGIALGFLLLPLMLLPIADAGFALGLRDAAPEPALAPEPAVLLAAVVVAPVSEELLFRRLLLPAAAERFGPALALLGVTALSAACHSGPWPALLGAATGAVLGLVMLASGSVALCIGLHAGLNLAALAGGVPPLRDPLLLLAQPPALAPALLLALVPIACGAAALGAARARGARRGC